MGTKTLNDAKLANIEQGEREAPGKSQAGLQKPFADSLTDPESAEGGMISKQRFLTQSDPDILSKLLKEANAPTFLDNRLRLAQTLYYGREEEEKRQKKSRED